MFGAQSFIFKISFLTSGDRLLISVSFTQKGSFMRNGGFEFWGTRACEQQRRETAASTLLHVGQIVNATLTELCTVWGCNSAHHHQLGPSVKHSQSTNIESHITHTHTHTHAHTPIWETRFSVGGLSCLCSTGVCGAFDSLSVFKVTLN